MLNESEHPHTDKAIEELNKLREVHCHLATHLLAVKQQTDSSVAGIKSVVKEEPPSKPPIKLLSCLSGAFMVNDWNIDLLFTATQLLT